MGGLGMVTLVSWVQNVGIEPLIWRNEEKVPCAKLGDLLGVRGQLLVVADAAGVPLQQIPRGQFARAQRRWQPFPCRTPLRTFGIRGAVRYALRPTSALIG